MKIPSNFNLSNSQEILRVLKEDPKVASVVKRGSVKGDKPSKLDRLVVPKEQATEKVSLSTQGRTAQLIRTAVASVPDVRTDRVEAFKEAVETGSYQVDPDKVAEAMVREFTVDSLLLKGFFE